MTKITIILILISIPIFAQNKNFNLGVSVGLGSIKGNSPDVTAYGLNAFVGFTSIFTDYIDFRLGFIYAQKVEQILPENRVGRYYPFIKVIYLKGVLKQPLSPKLFIEETLGLVYLNDRTFSDVNTWNYGANFSLMLGLDLRKKNKGFTIGPVIDYGLTINNSNASYIMFSLQTQYYFN